MLDTLKKSDDKAKANARACAGFDAAIDGINWAAENKPAPHGKVTSQQVLDAVNDARTAMLTSDFAQLPEEILKIRSDALKVGDAETHDPRTLVQYLQHGRRRCSR